MSHLFRREFTRRDFVQMSLASALGVSFSGWLPRLARAAEGQKQKQRACIVLWMNGGPSQMDTWDLKPGHKNGGPIKAIDTAVPGIQISEHLPLIAKEAKDLAIIRGMSTREGDHGQATHLMLTGYRQQEAVNYPALGALISKEIGRPDNELPNFVSVSPFRFGDAGAGFLGPNYAPLNVTGDSANAQARANMSVENLAPAGDVDKKSQDRRFSVLNKLQQKFTDKYGGDSAQAHLANSERAVKMVKTQGKSAFKLEDEPAALRDAYGRNRFGQGCLLARRLVERNVPFVEVTLAQVPGVDVGWDTHLNNFEMVRLLSQTLDPAFATLIKDLRERGLLETTTVVWMGEFGRTPTINPQGGRDHFPAAWSTVLAGGGIRGGQVYGKTNEAGMEVAENPVETPQLLATICKSLGIDTDTENITEEGRPIAIIERGYGPIDELLAKTTPKPVKDKA